MDQAAAIAFLDSFSAGTNTEAEHRDFLSWLQIAPAAELDRVLELALATHMALPESEGADANLRGRLEAALDSFEQERSPIPFIRRLYRLAAAAAILILLAGAWFYLLRTHPSNPSRPVQDIAPGGYHAILTLGNGRKVVLDSAGTGRTIAMQGTTRVGSTEKGTLRYDVDDNSEGVVFENTLTTRPGDTYKLILPDGSAAWINSGSSVKFPTRFSSKERQITLLGEAYFEIKDDPNRPFIVHTSYEDVQVLATHFDVMAYNEEPEEATTLFEGAVRILSGKSPAQQLKPGEQLQINISNRTTKLVKEVDLNEVAAWRNNEFRFVHRDLPYIMRQISRWYNVTIEYQNGFIPEEHFNGTISRFANASEVLNVLERTGRVHFTITADKITVKK